MYIWLPFSCEEETKYHSSNRIKGKDIVIPLYPSTANLWTQIFFYGRVPEVQLLLFQEVLDAKYSTPSGSN